MSDLDRGDASRRLRRRFFRNLGFGLLVFALAAGAWGLMLRGRKEGGLPVGLRRMHEWNERVARTLFRSEQLAPEFPRESATEPRVNGMIGLKDPGFKLEQWSLSLEGNGRKVTLRLPDLQKLPQVAMTTELKCIEGWSTITSWAGITLRSLLEKYGMLTPELATEGYVGLSTPDGKYYVGIEMATALHSQTLLAWEMNGALLTLDHGAPLRLATPLKYGIKNIKRVGRITVGPDRPSDYWAQQGYDWYSGH